MIEAATYDAAGNRVSVTDANGNVTTFEYDARGELTRINAPAAAATLFELDAMGDRTKETDPSGKVATRTYDDRRRLVSETVGSDTTTFAYDGNDNLTEVNRPASGGWTRGYDAANRLISITDPSGGQTSYEYDGNGNLLEMIDAAGQSISLVYDELNRLVSRTLADGSSESYEYDGNGNLTSRTDPNGWTHTATFDGLDRLTSLAFGGPGGVSPTQRSLAYDANNNVTSISESVAGGPSGVTTRVYDEFDRLTSVTDRLGRTIVYGYDLNGNRSSVSGGGVSATYSYDALNRMVSVTSNVGAANYSYFKNGSLQRVTYPNGASADYAYDSANRLTSIRNEAGSALVSEYLYTYDGNGNRLSQTERRTGRADEETTYVYDSVDRLSQVFYPDQTTVYTYDSVGNRLSEVSTDPSGDALVNRLYSYNSRHQVDELTDLLDPLGSVSYGYDANGNQTSRTTASGETTFTFDVLNRITEIIQDGTSLGSYRYDENGLRIQKTTSNGTSTYLYDDLAVLTRREGGDTTKYYYGPDRLLAVDDPTEGQGFYLMDALGSVTDIVQPDGALMARYWYDAWGNSREQVDTPANPFGYTGHEVDEETGLIYAKARFYDPAIGRFLSEDPEAGLLDNPPSLHRYLYTFQNPTTYVDPDGRKPTLGDYVVATGEAIGNTVVDILTGVAAVLSVADGHSGYERDGSRIETQPVGEAIAEQSGYAGMDSGADRFAEGYVERDVEKMAQGGAEVVGGASQMTLILTGGVQGARTLRPGGNRGPQTVRETSDAPGGELRPMSEPPGTERNSAGQLVDSQAKQFVKPKNAPNVKKWESKGGTVNRNSDGSVTYTDWEGNSVVYKDDVADFGPHSKTEVEIEDMKGDHYHDFKAANSKAGYGEGPGDHPEGTTWHHKDTKTMQNADQEIHRRFTHKGGVSEIKKKREEEIKKQREEEQF